MRRALAAVLLSALPVWACAVARAQEPTEERDPATTAPANPPSDSAGDSAGSGNDPAQDNADSAQNNPDSAQDNRGSAAGVGSDPDDATPPASELPEAHRPTIRLEVDTGDGVRTGDLVHVVVTAEVPEGDDVTVPDQELGTFEISDHRYHDAPIDGGRRRRFRFELDLLALEPGDQELPAIRLRVVTADGEMGIVTTEARTIEVGSHLGNEPDAQPRPPTRPVPVLEKDYTLLWVLGILGALILVAVISFFVARWWLGRRREARPPPPPRPPWEVAIEALEAIKREKVGLIAEARQAELVDRVSDVLRHYLGQRYDFNGLESTTDEVVTRLAKVKLRGVKLADITALLADSDLVKFARLVPDEAQCDRMLEGATRIVRATTPRPSATPSTTPATEGRGARIVTKDGEVVLPVSAHTIEEAEREIRAAVGAAFREKASDPSFEGTLRVALSAQLRPSDNVTDALRRLHARLSSELATIPLAGGRRARIVIEHFHESLRAAAEEGRAALRTIIDGDGVRVEERPVEGANDARASTARASVSARSATPAAVDTQAHSKSTMEIAEERALSPSERTRAIEATSSGAAEERRALASAPSARMKTGPVDWDRSAAASSEAALAPTEAVPVREPASDATKETTRAIGGAPPAPAAGADETKPTVRAESAGREVRASLDARALDRVLPAFGAKEHEAEGVLLRWITGVERPVRYVVAEDAIRASALTTLGVTRGGLHERALANLKRVIPPGFAPGSEPTVLDDPEGAAILALPEIVPLGETWIAYPLRSEGLVVMREGQPSTEAELARLAGLRSADPSPIFERPVRVSRRGFEPHDWPARSTDPGFASPDAPILGGRRDGEPGGDA